MSRVQLLPRDTCTCLWVRQLFTGFVIFSGPHVSSSFIPPSHNMKSPPGLSTFVSHIKDKPYWLFPPREARILMFRYKSLDVRVHVFYFSKENLIFPLTFLGKIHFLSFKRTLRSKVCVLHNWRIWHLYKNYDQFTKRFLQHFPSTSEFDNRVTVWMEPFHSTLPQATFLFHPSLH